MDGGEWLDFVGADLKHLTPRPEPVRAPRPERTEAPAREETEEPVVQAREPTPPEPVMVFATAEQEPDFIGSGATAEELNYEPDQERRDKFLSRFSRWAKKGA